jgi:vacuolar-type H+-ATPase subunit F/Vma7
MRYNPMKVIAIGKKEILIGFMLAGIKERLETDDPHVALKFLHELEEKETSSLVVITSDLYRGIEKEIGEIQLRKPAFIFYEFLGGGLKWREM